MAFCLFLLTTKVQAQEKKYYTNAPNDNATDVYFGDTHLHTSYSSDAGLIGTKLGPEEALRFARGEEVTSNHGLSTKLIRPLDFIVIADHAENLGVPSMIETSDPILLADEWGKKIHHLVKAGKGIEAYDLWLAGSIEGEILPMATRVRRRHGNG